MASVGLWIIGLPLWLVVGMIAGLFNMIPLIGPWVGAIPGHRGGPGHRRRQAGRRGGVVMIVVQQIDNHLITPTVMRRAVQLHPAAVMMALLAWGTIGGFFGLLLAVPAHRHAQDRRWPPVAEVGGRGVDPGPRRALPRPLRARPTRTCPNAELLLAEAEEVPVADRRARRPAPGPTGVPPPRRRRRGLRPGHEGWRGRTATIVGVSGPRSPRRGHRVTITLRSSPHR